MRRELEKLIGYQGTDWYSVYNLSQVYEQAEKAEQAIKDGGVYTTPHYLLLRCVTISAKKFAGATKHEAGFYYLIH